MTQEIKDDVVPLGTPLTDDQQKLVIEFIDKYEHPVKLLAKVFPTLFRTALSSRMPTEEIEQSAMYGVLRAAQLFNESRGVLFSTYATEWMRSGVQASLRRHVKWSEFHTRFLVDPLNGREEIPEDTANPPHPIDVCVDEMHKFVRHLSSREKFVIYRRYGIGFGYTRTLQEIADEMGVTKERVRQIQRLALEKMRRRERIDPNGFTEE